MVCNGIPPKLRSRTGPGRGILPCWAKRRQKGKLRMKAIVHIGAPKTGSSTIQEFLFRNTGTLAEQGFRFQRNVPGRGSQFEYPLAALASIGRLLPGREEQTRYSSTDLATHQATGAAVLRNLASLRASSSEPVALFSSEHVYPWIIMPEEISALDRMFGEHFDEVRYILYIRSQEDLIVSEYSEALKRGVNLRLDALIEQRSSTLQWEPRVRNWEKTVGRARFDLRLFDQGCMIDGDLLADFAHACGFSLKGLDIPPRANESLSAPAAECLRMMNERIPQLLHDGRQNPLHWGIVWNLMNLTPPNAPPLALTDEQSRRVQGIVAAANERLRADFFPERETLFSKSKDRRPGPREQVLEEALDLMSRLYVRLRLGKIKGLTEAEMASSVQRARGGVSNGIAPPPKQT